VKSRLIASIAAAIVIGVAGLGSADAASADAKNPEPRSVATVVSAPSGGVDALTRCEHRSLNGAVYTQYWCETQIVLIRWYVGDTLVAYEDILIDVFGPVMRERGGWVQLQGGIANPNRPGNEIGVFVETSSPARISVIGTDNAKYCNSAQGLFNWSGWGRC
jgi:hypothetical protein